MSVLSLSVNRMDMKSPSYSDRHNRWETVIKMLVEKGADVSRVNAELLDLSELVVQCCP